MKNNKEKNKKTFKELWTNPVSKSLIKLGMYGVFFLIIYLLIFISSLTNSSNIENNGSSTTTTTQKTISYNDAKNKFSSSSQNVIYTINDYYITGSINENVLIGTLEDNDTIYKIKYDGDKIYQVKKTDEVENEELLKDIKLDYLLPSKILDIINNPKNISTKSADEKVYTYKIDDSVIYVHLGTNSIKKINISDNGISYSLEYREVNNEE